MTRSGMDWIAQGMDSCCFIYAVANYQIWCGQPLPDMERAKDIGSCRHGATINHAAVVEYFGAKLAPTMSVAEVFVNGGIININHPIWNGHSFFVFPEGDSITAVNSWLGPLVATGIGVHELMPYTSGSFGYHWCSCEK